MDKKPKTYSEKLRDPRWQKTRLRILERDEWRCFSCGDNESTLHVHHRMYVYGKEPWDYPDELLVTLCEECHGFERSNWEQEQQQVVASLKRRFLSGDLCQIVKLIDGMPKMHVDEVQLCAVAWYLCKEEHIQTILDAYFDDLTKRSDRLSEFEAVNSPEPVSPNR